MNPKAVAAMKMREKQKQGYVSKDPMSPQNITKVLPNLSVPGVNAMSNPLLQATTNLASPKMPGMPRFPGLRKKLGR